MKTSMPPYLLPVLRLKAEAYPNEAIARELTLSEKTIETYCKRLRSFFKEAGVWQPHYSSKLGLTVCAQDYFSQHGDEKEAASSSNRLLELHVTSANLFEVLPDYAAKIYKNRPLGDALQHTQWAGIAVGQLHESLRTITPDPQKIGASLLLIGNELRERLLWAEAEPVLRSAEELLGTASSQAAIAAMRIAHVQIELGNYDRAEAELLRVQSTYGSVMDPITQTEWCTLQGWVDYDQGSYAQSEQWFQKCLSIAEAISASYLGETAHHFLGRVYSDWGKLITQKSQADVLFHKAAVQFDRVYEIHCGSNDQIGQAYDFFRKAQMISAQGEWREAQNLRQQAQHLFGSHLAVFSVDLEEARLALKEGELYLPRHKAEKALIGWAQVHKAEGMAEALHVLSGVHCIEGKLDQALELAVAAFCIYPYEQHIRNRQLWKEIQELVSEIIRVHDIAYFERIVDRFEERATSRQGHFSYLDYVLADRSADSSRIFGKLRMLILEKKNI